MPYRRGPDLPVDPWESVLHRPARVSKRFREWVFLNAATVLLGTKTGELLSLQLDEIGLAEDEMEAQLGELARVWGFDAVTLHQSDHSVKLLVYREERLQAVLDEAPFCVMVGQLNYRFPLRAAGFLGELKQRWHQHGEVPHEIGIALGYPLDDVFGYMGLLPLECKGVCGWMVFGSMEESQRRSCAFNNARCQALMVLAGAGAKRAG